MGVGGATGGVGGLRGERGEVKTEDLPARDTEPTASEPVSDEQVEPQVTPEPEVPTATDQSPLGPSTSQYDELRDVPAYLRQDDTADRFKGMAENSEVQDALAKAPAPTVAELLEQADSQKVEDVMDPESMEDAEAQASRSPTEATIGPLNSLRVTRRGKPFASEKEAQLASRKGIETPVMLNGGGFGVAAIAEVEQVRAMPPIPVDAPAHQGGAELQLDESNTAELGQLSDLTAQGLDGDADTALVQGDASQQPLVPAVDTGYRDAIPSNEQPEVTHDQPAQIPASSSEGQSGHPGSSQPTEVGTELTSTGRTDRAGVRNPTDLPTPDGPQKNDMTLTAPATDAGVVDSGAEIATTRREVSTEKQKESGNIKVPPVDEFQRGLKNGEKATVFSKQAQTLGPAPAKCLTQKEAELITKTWLKRYRGAAGVNIQIHATQAEMERVLGLEPTEGLIRRAAFNRDESVYILQRIPSVPLVIYVRSYDMSCWPTMVAGSLVQRCASLIEGLGKKLQRASPDDISPDAGKKFSQEDVQAPTKKGGVKMSQVATTADKAMEKLNLGPKPDIIDKTKTNLDKLRKYAEEAAGITDAADSGYVAARMATGAASTMQATMLYGLPEWKDGVIQRKAGTGEKDALLGIFSDLGADLHNWLGWMAGHRAELLMEQGRENL
ncbi:UNVERIFIED_CONTAM: hypothetical protein K2H54_000033 [Gekko kuhli]